LSRPAVSDHSCRSLTSGSLRALLHRSSALRSVPLSRGVLATTASADFSSGSRPRRSPWVSNVTFTSHRRALPAAFRATIGLRCCLSARPRFRPHCPFVFLRSKFCLWPFRAGSSRSRPGSSYGWRRRPRPGLIARIVTLPAKHTSGVALRLPPQSKFVTPMPCLLEIWPDDFRPSPNE
jgi:hypothetical protein